MTFSIDDVCMYGCMDGWEDYVIVSRKLEMNFKIWEVIEFSILR